MNRNIIRHGFVLILLSLISVAVTALMAVVLSLVGLSKR